MMQAEAAIVNYYHMNSTLCAHTDHSECDALSKPLLSVSFGNAAVFLIGGSTKSVRAPSPLLLRSGDILLMTNASRLCFHAVPRILADPFVGNLVENSSDETETVSCSYIHDKRININVRQVYTSDQEA
jgi:alkylated DNA repair protein alkB homolog 1